MFNCSLYRSFDTVCSVLHSMGHPIFYHTGQSKLVQFKTLYLSLPLPPSATTRPFGLGVQAGVCTFGRTAELVPPNLANTAGSVAHKSVRIETLCQSLSMYLFYRAVMKLQVKQILAQTRLWLLTYLPPPVTTRPL